MVSAKRALAILIGLAGASCEATEVDAPPEAPSVASPYADAPITPYPEDVRFFERPKMLAEIRRGEGPTPEVVLLERDPWGQVLGSESPRFALYSDGQAIYRSDDGFRSVRLSHEELSAIKNPLSAVTFSKFYGNYRIAEATDQPDNNLLLYGSQPVFLSVYGSLDDEQVTSRLPSAVAEAFDTIRTFDSARSKPWKPAEIEVMIWPYEYAPDPSIPWNEEWPDLSASSTVQRGHSYSLFLPASELEALKHFFARINPRGAVELDGRKWAASYRIPFPQEQLWMAPNPEVRKGAGEK